jgi:hypothetical protein
MRSIALVLGMMVLMLAAASCGTEATSSSCSPGDNCLCNGTGSCDFECDGVGCDFECRGAGSCNLTCTQGGCNALGSGAGSLNLSCPGGGCSVTCAGAGSCNIIGCPECACVEQLGVCNHL